MYSVHLNISHEHKCKVVAVCICLTDSHRSSSCLHKRRAGQGSAAHRSTIICCGYFWANRVKITQQSCQNVLFWANVKLCCNGRVQNKHPRWRQSGCLCICRAVCSDTLRDHLHHPVYSAPPLPPPPGNISPPHGPLKPENTQRTQSLFEKYHWCR